VHFLIRNRIIADQAPALTPQEIQVFEEVRLPAQRVVVVVFEYVPGGRAGRGYDQYFVFPGVHCCLQGQYIPQNDPIVLFIPSKIPTSLLGGWQSALRFVMERRNIEAIPCPQGQNSKIHRSLLRGLEF
jgi:hypothetical protein